MRPGGAAGGTSVRYRRIGGGIVLGPTPLGRFFPAVSAHLFTRAVLSSFEIMSTVGLVLYLFLIGSEMELDHLRTQRATASLTSLCSIALPFGLVMLLAARLRARFSVGKPLRLLLHCFLAWR